MIELLDSRTLMSGTTSFATTGLMDPTGGSIFSAMWNSLKRISTEPRQNAALTSEQSQAHAAMVSRMMCSATWGLW